MSDAFPYHIFQDVSQLECIWRHFRKRYDPLRDPSSIYPQHLLLQCPSAVSNNAIGSHPHVPRSLLEVVSSELHVPISHGRTQGWVWRPSVHPPLFSPWSSPISVTETKGLVIHSPSAIEILPLGLWVLNPGYVTHCS